MSCEGTAVMTVDSSNTDDILKALRKHRATNECRIIGSVTEGKPRVVMKTEIGGKKIVQVPYGEPIPRVC
jgi:hydrogenase expression/formation protein HypE